MAQKKLPPYLVWRDGRPRWNPGPVLHARGFKGEDLKDERGRWLDFGQAINAAIRLNAATRSEAPARLPPAARNMSALFAEYRTNKTSRYHKIAANTRADYDINMRILEAWCGDIAVPMLSRLAIREFHVDAVETRGLSMANALMRMLGIVLNFARKELKWVASNEAAELDLETPDGRLKVWTPY